MGGRFDSDDDDAFAARIEAEAAAWIRGTIREVNVLRQLKPGDVLVFRFSSDTNQRAQAAFTRQIHGLNQHPNWQGIRALVLPPGVEMMGVLDDRQEAGDSAGDE